MCALALESVSLIAELLRVSLSDEICVSDTFALHISNETLDPAQLRTSVMKRLWSGSSCEFRTLVSRCFFRGNGRETKGILTISRPFIPMMKSNHGSSGKSLSLLRSIWNPNELSPVLFELCWTASLSRRPMKRLRAPNMATSSTIRSDSSGDWPVRHKRVSRYK